MSERWPSLDQPRIRAQCVQVYPAPGVPHSYRCDCDSDGVSPSTEPPIVNDGGIADPSVVEAATCDQALQVSCGLSGRYIGFCERHSSWSGEKLVCFEQPGQGFLCHCPNLDEPVLHDDPDCEGALRRACASDCETAAGRCTAGDKSRYTCQCAIGIGGEVEDAPLCEDALHWWCDPACENPRGACYWQPDGTRIVCQCAGDPELHITAPDPNVRGDECHTPLERICGK